MTLPISLDQIRNVGIVAHVDAGKTTLTERVLYFAGRIHAIGEVHEGNTTTDSDPAERKHGITISAAAVSCTWRDHLVQLVDTPGHLDFTLEVERSLRVLDGAVVVLDGTRGVEPQTETVWRQADRHGVPRLVFVNKLDRPGASFEAACRSVEERLGARVVPVVLPWLDADERLVGVLDVVRDRALTFGGVRGRDVCAHPVPSERVSLVAAARARIVDSCADVDASFLAEAVEGVPTVASFDRAIRRGTIAGALVPALAGAAYADLGVQPLLDAVLAWLPSPADRAPVADARDPANVRPPSDDAPLAALAFKVVHDDHGARTFVRVYAGVLRKGALVHTGRAEKLRVGRLVRLFADSVEDVDEARAGAICAVLGSAIASGETLCDPVHPIQLDALRVPEAVVTMALEPRTRADRDRLGAALARLVSEDPSLRVRTDEETGETTLSGVGELHLTIAMERLEARHRTSVRASAPRVAYRETVAASAEVEHKHSKQSGGPGQFAVVRMRVEAGEPGTGVVFVDAVRGGEIPRPFVGGVREGVLRAASAGVLSGHPVVDVRVTLLGGATHPNDSSEMAFAIAGEHAFRSAMRAAGPVLLEPTARVVVHGPETSVGAVAGELGARRGRVTAIEAREREHVLVGEAPLAELFGWVTRVRGVSAGRASTVVEPAGYARAPASVVAVVSRHAA
ncbi:MAG: elongation factor G [Sandaracinus sp.]